MTPTTLQALRRLLFFSAPEAAEHIGHVTERSWRMWEDGSRGIPDDVVSTVARMVAWRKTALAEAEKAIKDARRSLKGREAASPQVTWYITPEAWAQAEPCAPEMWRPHCSVVAELCARHGAEAAPSD